MERTKIDKVDGRIKWKKTGGGSFRLHNKIIKPGQEFLAFPHEISDTIRDVIIPIDGLPEEKSVDGATTVFQLKHRNGPWFDIMNAEGKQVNDKALSRENALKLIEELSAE